MRPASGLAVALAAMWIWSGCAIHEPGAQTDAPASVTSPQLSEGYALLYDLLSKEKQVSMLSLIKKESPELKSMLERISAASKAAVKELDALAPLAPPVNLKVQHLPKMELAARESIDKETSKELLHSKGVALEFNMASSQLAGLNYAAHLARSLALVESNPSRKQFLTRTDRTFSELHAEVYRMLFARYQS